MEIGGKIDFAHMTKVLNETKFEGVGYSIGTLWASQTRLGRPNFKTEKVEILLQRNLAGKLTSNISLPGPS